MLLFSKRLLRSLVSESSFRTRDVSCLKSAGLGGYCVAGSYFGTYVVCKAHISFRIVLSRAEPGTVWIWLVFSTWAETLELWRGSTS